MTNLAPPTDQNAFLAAIGHICLQWSRLEHSLLILIGTIENMPAEKAYLAFAGLDMIPRVNMAITLAQENKLPRRMIGDLKGIRRELQKDGSNLANRRNMFVHGVHKFGDAAGEYVLTMSRWRGDKRDQTVTLIDAGQLAHEIALQAQIADSIFRNYGIWKFGVPDQGNGSQHIARTKAALRLIRAHQVKRAVKLLLSNLKPW